MSLRPDNDLRMDSTNQMLEKAATAMKDTANGILNFVRAWKGKDAPSTVDYEVNKAILGWVKRRAGEQEQHTGSDPSQKQTTTPGAFARREDERRANASIQRS